MSVKASVSISEQQDEFARDLVARGRYSSVSAVVQQGLDLLKQRDEAERTELEALRTILEERRKGPFVSVEEFRSNIDALIARKRGEYGLDGLKFSMTLRGISLIYSIILSQPIVISVILMTWHLSGRPIE